MIKFAEYDQVWLVRSAGLILGPLNLVELTQAIKDRRVALLDEVRTPETRWAFIRETPELSEVVRIIRESDARQSSRTGKTQIDRIDDERTPGISNSGVLLDNAKPAEEAPRESSINSEERRRSSAYADNGPTVSIKSLPRPHVPLGINSKNSNPRKIWSIVSAIVLIAVLGGTVLFRNHEQKKVPIETAVLPPTEIFSMARKYKDNGLYEKSMMMFQRAIGPSNPEVGIKYEMIPLMLQDSKYYPKAQIYIDELLPMKNLSPEMNLKLMNWAGLLAMKQGQYAAAESKLKLASEKYQANQTIQVNRVMNFFLAGQFDDSLSLAHGLKFQGINNPLVSLTQAFSMLALPAQKFVAVKAKALVADLSFIATQRKDLAYQALLASAALSDRLSPGSASPILLERILEQAPGVTRAYLRELDYDSHLLLGPQLNAICESLSRHYSQQPQGLALGIFCQLEAENNSGASADLESALAKFPSDPNLMALKAAIYKSQGRGHEARQFLGEAKTRSALLLLGQLCLTEKDIPCVEASTKTLLANDSNDIEAVFQLAQVQLLRDRRDLASQSIDRGLSIDRSYKPLLEIREEIGEF